MRWITCLAVFVCFPYLANLDVVHAQHTEPIRRLTAVDAIRKLRSIGFWTGRSDSLKEAANTQAVLGFQKLAGLKRTGRLTEANISLIMTSSRPTAKGNMRAAHLEIDLDRQLLFVIDSQDEVRRILCISSGSGKFFESEGRGRLALTPRGMFKVYYKISGWRTSPLGKLYYPMYIHGGVAIHGAGQVPARPQSHGCIRIPMFAAKELFQITPIGRTVLIYGSNPATR